MADRAQSNTAADEQRRRNRERAAARRDDMTPAQREQARTRAREQAAV